MRLYKVVILVNIALGTGFLAGYQWWGQEVIRLRREVAAGTRQTAGAGQAGAQRWSVRGIVRQVVPESNTIFITHENIPGLMGPMTMSFRADDPKLLRGLTPGDEVRFTLRRSDDQLVLVALEKEERRP